MTEGPSAPAGWYVDDDVERWWDGSAWTEATRRPDQATETTAAPTALVVEPSTSKRKSVVWRYWMIVPVVLAAVVVGGYFTREWYQHRELPTDDIELEVEIYADEVYGDEEYADYFKELGIGEPGASDADCPDTVDQAAGEEFTCLVSWPDNENMDGASVTVSMQNDAGEYLMEFDQ